MSVHPSPDVLMTRIGPVLDDPALRFEMPYGLIGLPQLTSFVLLGKGESLAKWLCSRQNAQWSFPVLETAAIWPAYRPLVPTELQELWSCSAADVAFLSILVVADRGQAMRTNLQAPIALHRGLHQAVQIVLTDGSYPMAKPLSADEQSRVRACWS